MLLNLTWMLWFNLSKKTNLSLHHLGHFNHGVLSGHVMYFYWAQVLRSLWFSLHLLPPSLPVSVDPPNSLQVGSTAALQCRVKEPDQTLRVEWQKPDGSVVTSNTVHLDPVETSHGGNWQCCVVNNEDQFSKTLSITVTGGAAGETSCVSLCYNEIDPRGQN